MSGYTADALSDMLQGQQPDTLLLGRAHLEAMLSGLLCPQDLLRALLNRAFHRGDLSVPLTDLLVARQVPEPRPR